MKLWDKNISTEERILEFTVGKDPVFDPQLAPYDALGSMAHAIMLAEVGLITRKEAKGLVNELSHIFHMAVEDGLILDSGSEDIHTQVEMMLISALGETGKKIHTGRSRNDQVMVDIKLFLRDEIEHIATAARSLADALLHQAEKHKEVIMPGYTHMQVAMPSSFGLWFGAYAEALADDLLFLKGIYSLVNQNPLGSAAGYGSSFPVDRTLTTRLLRFENMHINSLNAQLNRGKTEWYAATGIGAIASTVARMAMDTVLFLGQNFRFFGLPGELTTGSSIMPHKKNPDVLELIRARCNRLTQVAQEITSVTGNLTSGYHRDFQILKEILHPSIEDIKNCLGMMQYVMEKVEVNTKILEDKIYRHIFSVEEVNKKVKEGISFRDAYREVAESIEKEQYRSGRDHAYTHQGSIGNPGIEEIKAKLDRVYGGFGFAETMKIEEALKNYFEEK